MWDHLLRAGSSLRRRRRRAMPLESIIDAVLQRAAEADQLAEAASPTLPPLPPTPPVLPTPPSPRSGGAAVGTRPEIGREVVPPLDCFRRRRRRIGASTHAPALCCGKAASSHLRLMDNEGRIVSDTHSISSTGYFLTGI